MFKTGPPFPGTMSTTAQLARAPKARESPLASLLPRSEAAWRRVFLALLVLGVGLRILSYWVMDIHADGARYSVMGWSLLQHGEFIFPHGNFYFPAGDVPEYSHHYPPGYPVYLAGWYALFGYGAAVTKIAGIASGLALIGVAYWCTQNLYRNPTFSLFVASFVAISRDYISTSAIGYSESFVEILFVLTMWGILKSLESPPYILVGGVCAGLAYLTKSSMGWFFLIAGVGGFLWRFRFMGMRVFKDRYYLAAAALFGGLVATWAYRNILRHGSWQTSAWIEAATQKALANPGLFWGATLLKIPLFLYFLLGFCVFFLPEMRKSLRTIWTEHTSGLWLSVGLTVVVGIPLAAILWTLEGEVNGQMDWGQVWSWDNVRYVMIILVPLLWLVGRELDWKRASRRIAAMAAIFLVGALAFSGAVFNSPRLPEVAASELLIPELQGGEIIAIDGMECYYLYPYLVPHLPQGDVRNYKDGETDADYVITVEGHDYAGYHTIHQWGKARVLQRA